MTSYLSSAEVLTGLNMLLCEAQCVTCRAGACFQKSNEMLLLERLHASRSASAHTGRTGIAPPAVRTMDGRESSMTAAVRTDAIEEQSFAAAHVNSAYNGCLGSGEVLKPMSSSQQQQHGMQTCREPAQVSSCAGSSTRQHAETDSMHSREAEVLQGVEGALGAAVSQKHDNAQKSISFLDDVGCLDIE